MNTERHVRILNYLTNKLKRITTLIAAILILVVFVAADMKHTSMSLTGAAAGIVTETIEGNGIFWLLLTGWLITIGAMCVTLKKIPGIKPGGSESSNRSY